MARTRPPQPAEFRQQMVELARTGKTPAELSREFGVTAQTIANWIGADGRDARRGKTAGDTLSSAEREELVRLRRQPRQVQMERDILAKATAWFAANRDEVLGRSVPACRPLGLLELAVPRLHEGVAAVIRHALATGRMSR